MTKSFISMIDVARTLQAQAAELSERTREYRELGPSWAIHAAAMQRLAQGHYEMARQATEWTKAKQKLSRQVEAVIVGRG